MIEIDLQKLERGKATEWKTVKRGGKTFKQRFRTGTKESSKMTPENAVSVVPLEKVSGVTTGVNVKKTFMVTFKDGSKGLYKSVSPASTRSEVFTYNTAKILKWDIVPETVRGNFGHGQGSVQRWVEGGKEPQGAFSNQYNSVNVDKSHFNDLSKIFIMDMLLGNTDRHEGNVVIKGSKCHSIDNDSIGKSNTSTTEFMKEVDDRTAKNIIKDPITDESGSPMVAWLDSNKLGVEGYKEFKSHVMANMKTIIDNKAELTEYNESMTKSVRNKIGNNLDAMVKYYEGSK